MKLFLSGDKPTWDSSSTLLLTPEGQSPSGVRSPSLFITAASVPLLSLHYSLSLSLSVPGGGCRGCDGDWRAEPKSLPGSEGSQSGPTLPQHALRLSVQGVPTEQCAQRERRGQLNFNCYSLYYSEVVTSINCGCFWRPSQDVADSGRKYQLELSVQEIISNVRYDLWFLLHWVYTWVRYSHESFRLEYWVQSCHKCAFDLV